MLDYDVTGLLHKLNEMNDSTTLLLESLRGSSLRLNIESQVETRELEANVIKRTVKLYFESSAAPVMYCVSYLNKNNLKWEEYQSLVEEQLPIGKVLHCYNRAELIRKINISVTRENDENIAEFLNVKSPLVTRKRYDYWVGDREIGSICEFYNEESLERI